MSDAGMKCRKKLSPHVLHLFLDGLLLVWSETSGGNHHISHGHCVNWMGSWQKVRRIK